MHFCMASHFTLKDYLGQGSDRINWGKRNNQPASRLSSNKLQANDLYCMYSNAVSKAGVVAVGYFYLVVEEDGSVNTTMAHSTLARTSFMEGDKFPPDDTV